jgi:nucleotide-binding universal stress UspA family protein
MTQPSGRIVVGLDGSPGGRAALTFALHDAARRGAAVEVVTAFDTTETLAALCGTAALGASSSTTDIAEAVETQTSRTVAEVAAELLGGFLQLPPVTVTAVGGAAAPALTSAARTEPTCWWSAAGAAEASRAPCSVRSACSAYSTHPARSPWSTRSGRTKQPSTTSSRRPLDGDGTARLRHPRYGASSIGQARICHQIRCKRIHRHRGCSASGAGRAEHSYHPAA